MEQIMNTTFLTTLGALVLSVSLVNSAQAQSLAECLSTDVVDFDGSVVDAAIATPELSTLVDAVVAAGLDEALATTEDITVYAPTNDAFAALPGDVLNAIVGDEALLTAVLTYHVTPGEQDPRRYTTAVRRNTLLQGQKVYYSRFGGAARVNQSAIACQGVQTDNGVVWVIDSVLIPQF
jgi:uncharacterized surface protein with fasciclin (FAS1) repeats